MNRRILSLTAFVFLALGLFLINNRDKVDRVLEAVVSAAETIGSREPFALVLIAIGIVYSLFIWFFCLWRGGDANRRNDWPQGPGPM